jgi:hypothetical protein
LARLCIQNTLNKTSKKIIQQHSSCTAAAKVKKAPELNTTKGKADIRAAQPEF